MHSELSTRVAARQTLAMDRDANRPTSPSTDDARKVKLVVVEGKPLGAEVPIEGRRFLIGSDQTCGLRPKNPMASARECAILRRGPHIVVRDLGSANGTLVNEHCLHAGEEQRVADGDRLQVGRLIFSIRIEDAHERASIESESESEFRLESEVERWLLGSTELAIGESREFQAFSKSATIGTTLADRALSATSATAKANAKAKAKEPTTPAPFSYRRFDPDHEVLRIGLGCLQVIDEEQIVAVRKSLVGMIAQPRFRRLVLDLSDIDVLPSMAIALIVSLAARCRARGGELRLCSLSMEVDRVISRLRIDRFVGCFAGPIEARDAPWPEATNGVRS